MKTAYEKRTKGDYSDMVVFEEEEVKDLLDKTSEFSIIIKGLLK
ncbi:MAG: hypothetical protein PHW04_11670 [Candidatus Wallbacteria bacterium]|nr:hypothetical protein [Candidatus Wallbacteria bacterium]